jgi:hypothetical protein
MMLAGFGDVTAYTEIERALAQFVGPTGYDSPCEVPIAVCIK